LRRIVAGKGSARRSRSQKGDLTKFFVLFMASVLAEIKKELKMPEYGVEIGEKINVRRLRSPDWRHECSA